MKYLILIQSNPASLGVWETLSHEQRVEFGQAHFRLTAELAASGELVCSEGLGDPSLATWVSVRDGQTLTSDGPYAEVKEHLAGFYLIDCESPQRAVEIAALVPDAANTQVELRPVLDMSSFEMET
jgi:hypothetical protein